MTTREPAALSVLGEIAAGDQADTHRVEVAGQRRFLVRDRVVGRILEPLPFEDVADVIADVAPQRPQVDAGCRLDARDCPQPRHDLPLHRADLIDRLVGGRRQRNLGGDDAVGLEAEVLAAQRVEAGHQQRGADQQHERQGDLRRHEDVAQPAVDAAGTGPGVVTKRRAERHFTRLEERRQRAEQAGADRQRRRDREGAPVDGDIVAARQFGAGDPRQRRHCQPGDADTEEAAGDRKRQDFADELTRQPSSRGAEHDPRRDVAPAIDAAGQQQVRHVGAGDQQHRADRAQQQEQRLTRRAQQLGDERPDDRAERLRHLRPVLPGQRLNRDVERGPRLFDRDARPQPAHRDHPEQIAIVQRLLSDRALDRRPHLGIVGIGQPARHDADDGVRLVIEHHRPADDRRVAAVEPLPDAVPDDDDARRFEAMIVGAEGAAEGRGRTEDVEERIAYQSNLDLLRIAGAGDAGREVDRRHRRDRFEGIAGA